MERNKQRGNGLISPDTFKNKPNPGKSRTVKRDYSLVERSNEQILTEEGKQLLNEGQV